MKTKLYGIIAAASAALLTGCNQPASPPPPAPQADQTATNSIAQGRDEFIAATDKKLAELDAKIDRLSASIADAADDAKVEIKKEIADLRTQRDAVRKQYDQLKGVNQDLWDKTKADFQQGWDKLVRTYDDTAAKIHDQASNPPATNTTTQ
jgi:chromosome segregation ATPase